jgi:hypothetical protein
MTVKEEPEKFDDEEDVLFYDNITGNVYHGVILNKKENDVYEIVEKSKRDKYRPNDTKTYNILYMDILHFDGTEEEIDDLFWHASLLAHNKSNLDDIIIEIWKKIQKKAQEKNESNT